MKDTSPKMTEYLNEKFESVSPGQRIEMATSMFDFAREIVISSRLKQERPGISDSDIKRELFSPVLRGFGVVKRSG